MSLNYAMDFSDGNIGYWLGYVYLNGEWKYTHNMERSPQLSNFKDSAL